ncbi:hypothetical protein PHMEG_00015859 [Phytophthora megakarya]|uniref:Transcription factor CBF/NF-Y/archaeal histone domain-containing protein n=1 Tax=Phytophthora megakarya TaxID=4795 RepID=A0A225W0P7_9STRA|nr:hypothetical protein PHMEG_00015859 [Phytophthora megakarya]
MPSTTITTGYRPSTTSVPPISPRVAKQFYDLDLATRTSTESDDKMYLPTKMVSKIMYTISPAHSAQENEVQESINISDDAVIFMQECVTEFLLYFTSEARDLSVMQNRRTKKGVGLSISGSNVVEGMENLGFTSYAQVLSGYNEKVKASQDAAARKKMERKKLIQQQALQKATAAAKAAMAANVAKAAAAAKSSVSYSYQHLGIKPAQYTRPVGNISTLARPITSMSTNSLASRGVPMTRPITSMSTNSLAPRAVPVTTPARLVAPVSRTVAIPSKSVAVSAKPIAVSAKPVAVAQPTKPGVVVKPPTSAEARAPTTK